MMQGRSKESKRREMNNNNDAEQNRKEIERKQRASRKSEFISDARLAFRESEKR